MKLTNFRNKRVLYVSSCKTLCVATVDVVIGVWPFRKVVTENIYRPVDKRGLWRFANGKFTPGAQAQLLENEADYEEENSQAISDIHKAILKEQV